MIKAFCLESRDNRISNLSGDKTFEIIGISLAQKKEVDKRALGKMAVYWFLTFPIAAIFAGVIYFGFFSFGLS